MERRDPDELIKGTTSDEKKPLNTTYEKVYMRC